MESHWTQYGFYWMDMNKLVLETFSDWQPFQISCLIKGSYTIFCNWAEPSFLGNFGRITGRLPKVAMWSKGRVCFGACRMLTSLVSLPALGKSVRLSLRKHLLQCTQNNLDCNCGHIYRSKKLVEFTGTVMSKYLYDSIVIFSPHVVA